MDGTGMGPKGVKVDQAWGSQATPVQPRRPSGALANLQEALAQGAPLQPDCPALPESQATPQGEATPMGGAWAVTYSGKDKAAAAELATFQSKTEVIAAVAATSAMGASADLPHRSPEGEAALAAYRGRSSSRQSLPETEGSQVDLLD